MVIYYIIWSYQKCHRLQCHLYISHWTSLLVLPFPPCSASPLICIVFDCIPQSLLWLFITSLQELFYSMAVLCKAPHQSHHHAAPAPMAAWSLPQLVPSKWFIFVNSIFPFLLCWNGYSQSLKCLFDHISGLLDILILFLFSIVFDSASIKTCFQVFWDSSDLEGCAPSPVVSEFSHSLKLVQLPFSWKWFQSLFTPSLSPMVPPFFHIAGWPLSNGSGSNGMSMPQTFLQTSFHSLLSLSLLSLSWPQGINVAGQFLLQFSHDQILDKRVCACACLCTLELSLTWVRTRWQYLWNNWDTIFPQLFSNTGLPTTNLPNTREKFKRERQLNNSGEYNWLHKQFRLFCSLWFLQAYFYLCFITKAFPITWLFVKLRFNIWNLQPLFIDNITDSSIYFSPLVEKWNEENFGVNEEHTWILNNEPLL